MILKGNQRAGGQQMAKHLLNGDRNEHVTVHEVRGFIASDVTGALNEAYALSKATKCKQFMYSLSLNPPQDERVPVATFEAALERIEKELGLEGQPRVVVFHEKQGRRHAHCVWSRIDIEKMKAINIAFPKRKLNVIAKSLYLEHAWKMPDGFRDKRLKNPLNYTRAQWQQAARIGRKPADIKSELQECWIVSDSKNSFENILRESGYYLARGNRRGYVAVDVHGEVFSLTRQLGLKKKELAARLGKPETLPSVAEVKIINSKQLSTLFKRYNNELEVQHKKSMQPLLRAKREMIAQHRNIRKELDEFQKERWQVKKVKRSERIRQGFKGLWDKISGKYFKTRNRNEQETWKSHLRDQNQREELIQEQLAQRQKLQMELNLAREKNNQERKNLIRELSHVTSHDQEKGKSRHEKDTAKTHEKDIERDDPKPDLEPEI